uniref:Uncharacterized protein n=1 Tax=Nelumbo nucifera TaxID=4432 RepID=A0A822ZRU3_NELNU|nr:TPA_asm: hypothetical protein HUJ06_017530 [Nelumbo nucifera]
MSTCHLQQFSSNNPCLHCCPATFDGPLYVVVRRRACLLFEDFSDLPILPSLSSFPIYATVRRPSMALFTLLSEGEPVSSSKILATFLFCPPRFQRPSMVLFTLMFEGRSQWSCFALQDPWPCFGIRKRAYLVVFRRPSREV